MRRFNSTFSKHGQNIIKSTTANKLHVAGFFENVIIAQFDSKFPTSRYLFTEAAGTLLFPRHLANGRCLEIDKFTAKIRIPFFPKPKLILTYILHLGLTSSPFLLSFKNISCIIHFSIRDTCHTHLILLNPITLTISSGENKS
jgi:hypothetical protein